MFLFTLTINSRMSLNYEEIWNQMYTQKQTENKNENEDEIKEEKCCDNYYTRDIEGRVVCVSCGVVSSNTIFDENIFSFQNGENNMYLRSFTSELYPVSSQSTYISGNSKIAKIQAWNSMPYNERVIWEVSNELNSKLSERFSSRIIQDTLFIYKSFYEKTGIFRGENKKGFVAVALYIATSKNFAPATPKEISILLDVDLKSMYKCIQKYSEITGQSIENTKKASDFIEVYSNKIGIDFRTRKVSTKIINVVEKYKILGGTIPQNVCIATIVFVCKEMKNPLDTKKITKDFSISNTTLEKTVAIITSNKQKIFKSISDNS